MQKSGAYFAFMTNSASWGINLRGGKAMCGWLGKRGLI